MTGKSFLRCFTAAAVSLSLLFSVQGVLPASATSLNDLRDRQSQLKQQQAQVAEQIKKLKNDKSKQLEYKNALTTQINNVQSQIDGLNQQISDLDNDILDKEKQIAGKQKDIDSNYQKLKERLRALYLTGEASNIEIVLNAQNIMDLADKAEIMHAITEHDTGLINTLRDEMNSVKNQKAQIEQNRKSVAAAREEYDSKQNELNSLFNETKQVIAEISKNQSQAEEKSNQLNKEEQQAEGQIDAWYQQYYEEQRRQQQQQGGSNGGNGGGNNGGGSGGYVSNGNFTWPVPSCTNITQGFGSYAMGSFHKGIDISRGGIYGAPIVAADSGRVIKAGFGVWGDGYGGYGNVVAIDHGGGYSTLYGHMSSVACSVGQQVSKGQVIGYVGNSGQSYGAHLHFEIRVNGSAVNPMAYFG